MLLLSSYSSWKKSSEQVEVEPEEFTDAMKVAVPSVRQNLHSKIHAQVVEDQLREPVREHGRAGAVLTRVRVAQSRVSS